MKKMAIIAAIDEEFGIGKNGEMPWHIPEDFKWFKEITKNSICIMGRNTFTELADKFKYNITGKLLPNRLSCVITSHNIQTNDNVKVFSNINECLKTYETDDRNIFFIGGAGIFSECLYLVNEIYLTCVVGKHSCTTFFPKDDFEHQKFELNLKKSTAECNFYHGFRK